MNELNNKTDSNQAHRQYKGHILIIDDIPDVHVSMIVLLDRHGYKVSIAPNGKTGIEMALSRLPDLIILDVSMPDMSGIEVLVKLKRYSKTNSIPVIMVTGSAEFDVVNEARVLGISGYVTKPYDMLKLLTRIQIVMRNNIN